MKRILIVSFIAILTATAVGCECCQGMFRGSRLFSPQPDVLYDDCPTVDACAPCGTVCDPCGTAAPATILPGPETYAPTTVVPAQ